MAARLRGVAHGAARFIFGGRRAAGEINVYPRAVGWNANPAVRKRLTAHFGADRVLSVRIHYPKGGVKDVKIPRAVNVAGRRFELLFGDGGQHRQKDGVFKPWKETEEVLVGGCLNVLYHFCTYATSATTELERQSRPRPQP